MVQEVVRGARPGSSRPGGEEGSAQSPPAGSAKGRAQGHPRGHGRTAPGDPAAAPQAPPFATRVSDVTARDPVRRIAFVEADHQAQPTPWTSPAAAALHQGPARTIAAPEPARARRRPPPDP